MDAIHAARACPVLSLPQSVHRARAESHGACSLYQYLGWPGLWPKVRRKAVILGMLRGLWPMVRRKAVLGRCAAL
eukprot:5887318-Prymnesium_polylepis.1